MYVGPHHPCLPSHFWPFAVERLPVALSSPGDKHTPLAQVQLSSPLPLNMMKLDVFCSQRLSAECLFISHSSQYATAPRRLVQERAICAHVFFLSFAYFYGTHLHRGCSLFLSATTPPGTMGLDRELDLSLEEGLRVTADSERSRCDTSVFHPHMNLGIRSHFVQCTTFPHHQYQFSQGQRSMYLSGIGNCRSGMGT